MPNPRHLDAVLGALRRAQRRVSRRRGPDRRTRVEPSHRWRKAKAKVAALHTRVAAQRRDGLHQLTTRLVREHDTIVIEDLHVAGMLRNKRLARHIAGLGMGEFRRQLDYKATPAGVRVHVADRWFPVPPCSACGAVRAKLTLAEREFACSPAVPGWTGTSTPRSTWPRSRIGSSWQLRPDAKQPAGNPGKTTTGGTGYRHGKTPGPAGSHATPAGGGS